MMDRTAAPSLPYMTDEWEPTDERLWLKVLMVAKGKKKKLTRPGADGLRTINAPNRGRGFRRWPSPKALAWAVKQYNGFGGRWRGKGESKEAGQRFSQDQVKRWGQRIAAQAVVGRFKGEL